MDFKRIWKRLHFKWVPDEDGVYTAGNAEMKRKIIS